VLVRPTSRHLDHRLSEFISEMDGLRSAASSRFSEILSGLALTTRQLCGAPHVSIRRLEQGFAKVYR
jgi:hypothetical protein